MLHGDGYGNGDGDKNRQKRNTRPKNVSQRFLSQPSPFSVDMQRFSFFGLFLAVSRFQNISGTGDDTPEAFRCNIGANGIFSDINMMMVGDPSVMNIASLARFF
ncbi:hypothetical protein Tco_1259842 [Tanacetum coccineum]